MYIASSYEDTGIVVNNGGGVNIRQIECLASEIYIETPRFITFVHHVQKDDDSLFFCIRVSTVVDPHTRELVSVWEKRSYVVPRQDLIMLRDPEYGQFVCAEVMGQENLLGKFWLISHCTSRFGFVIGVDMFTPPKQ